MNREIKFRAWHKDHKKIEYSDNSSDVLGLLAIHLLQSETANRIFMQFSGLQDSLGVDIYEGDKVYLAGYGVYEVEFPFMELYEAKAENDLGEIVGCLYS